MKNQHKYNVITTHWKPQLDELAGNYLLERHGAEWGITRDTPVSFMASGDFENPPMSELPGVLYNGCGLDSWTNEHYHEEKDKSACYLIARELRLDRLRYGSLVEEVTREDRYGAGGIKNHLAQAVKDLYDMGWSYVQVYSWVRTALIALTDGDSCPCKFSMDTETCAHSIEKKWGENSARRWYKVVPKIRSWNDGEYIKARAYLHKNPQLFQEVETYKGKMKVFAPDEVQFNARIGAAARSQGAQVIIIQGKLDFDQIGVLIQQGHNSRLSFSLVLEELRKHELLHKGKLDAQKVSMCAGEGTLEVCPIWHGHQSATGQSTCFAVYNRSKSRPCGPSTSLEWDYLRGLALETLKQTPGGELVNGVDGFLAGDSSLDRVPSDINNLPTSAN